MLAHIPASNSREMAKRFAIRRFGLIIRRNACSLNGKAARYEGRCRTCSGQAERQAEVIFGSGGIAQLVERRTDNPDVRGSIPRATTITTRVSLSLSQ